MSVFQISENIQLEATYYSVQKIIEFIKDNDVTQIKYLIQLNVLMLSLNKNILCKKK